MGVKPLGASLRWPSDAISRAYRRRTSTKVE
jgi:hypothetical protein